MAAPAKMPGMPCGAKGVRLLLWPKGDPANTTYRIEMIFIPVTTAWQTHSVLLVLAISDLCEVRHNTSSHTKMNIQNKEGSH